MSDPTVSASEDDAKADTKFERMYREHREAKLDARRLQGELQKFTAVAAEADTQLVTDTQAANADYTIAVAECDIDLRNALAVAKSEHAGAGRRMKRYQEAYAKAVKRVESKQEALREEFNAEMRNQ